MNKDSWYQSRILWKANQHKLLEKKECYLFDELSEDKKLFIEKKLSTKNKLVLVFWQNRDRWTALGTRAIYSFFDNSLQVAKLDEIAGNMSIYNSSNTDSAEIKKNADRLFLENSKQIIWLPQSEELFAMMNILLMFPLNTPKKPCKNSGDTK